MAKQKTAGYLVKIIAEYFVPADHGDMAKLAAIQSQKDERVAALRKLIGDNDAVTAIVGATRR